MSARRRFRALATLLTGVAAALLTAGGARAGQPRLVADIDPAFPDAQTYTFTDAARAVAALGNQAFFVVRQPGDQAAPELLVTDGTAARTRVIAGVAPSFDGHTPAPISMGGLLYFITGNALWRSDGTIAGTFELAGGAVGSGGVARLGDQLVFTACALCSPWITDGTLAGTHSLADVVPELAGVWAQGYVAAGGRVYFFGPPTGDSSVWSTDGTAAGTHVLWHGRQVGSFAAAGDHAVFFSSGSTQTFDLWSVAEGQPATALASVGATFSPNLTTVGGLAYWTAYDPLLGYELWRSDGTPAGTARITDLSDPHPFWRSEDVPSMAVAGGKVFFVARDAGGVGRLTVTTGTPDSTRSLSTGCAEACPVLNLETLVPLGERVVFTAGPFNRESVWVSDGTAAGTRRLATPAAGSAHRLLATLDGRALFSQSSSGGALSEELWISDGTQAGTKAVARLDGVRFGSNDLHAVVVEHRVFFAAPAGRESRVFVTDGTAAGTRLIAPFGRNGVPSRPSEVVATAGGGVFTACRNGNWTLWRVSEEASTAPPTALWQVGPCGFLDDPPMPLVVGQRVFVRATPAGGLATLMVGPLAEGSPTQLPVADVSELMPVDGGVGFFVDKFFYQELWTSDGTVAGTRVLSDFPQDIQGIESGPLSLDATRFLFTVVDDQGERELWISNGTAAGTYGLTAVPGALQGRVLANGGTGYFFIERSAGSLELWRSDGTAAGTRQVRAFAGLYALPPTIDMALRDGLLYFVLADGTGPAALWRSDGTSAGTQVAATLTDVSGDNATSKLTTVGALLFFRHCTYPAGCELWRSDGSAAGTSLVVDLAPGGRSSSLQELTSFGGKLLFAASDAGHGTELWTSDGTAAGTRLVADLAPGPASSGPRALRRVGQRLYFAADDGIHGEEPWSVKADELVGCHSSALSLCLNGGRFEVTAFWRDFQGVTGEGHAVALTGDTGYFWFFSPANVEATLKVLDGRGLNDHFWVFYGALSSVEYALTVRDTESGASRRYYNPASVLASVGDTEGFGPRGALAARHGATQVGGEATPAVVLSSAAKAECVAGPQRLCLNGGRFAVTASWRDFAGHTGTGTAVSLSTDTGYFWFFGEENVEVVLKVLDGRPVNQKFWVFYGALSSVEYTLTVTDTAAGTTRQYHNPSGQFASVADTSAF